MSIDYWTLIPLNETCTDISDYWYSSLNLVLLSISCILWFITNKYSELYTYLREHHLYCFFWSGFQIMWYGFIKDIFSKLGFYMFNIPILLGFTYLHMIKAHRDYSVSQSCRNPSSIAGKHTLVTHISRISPLPKVTFGMLVYINDYVFLIYSYDEVIWFSD